MGNSFSKLFQRTRRGAILKAILLAVALGVIAFSAVLTVWKLTGESIDPLIYIAAAAGAALVGGGAMLLLSWPSEKRLARRLDERLKLNEKVQTMVAFKEGDSAMIAIQRENTEYILSSEPKKSFRTGREWLNLILPIIAVAAITVALLLPTKGAEMPPEEPPIVDPDFDITEIQIQELEDLIQYVKGSNMETEPRAEVVTLLEGLLAKLKAATKESQMKTEVVSVISSVQLLLDRVNSADDISFELSKCSSEELKGLAYMISSLNYSGVKSSVSAVRLSLSDELPKEELAELCNALSDELTVATGASGVDENDALYVQIVKMASELADAAARIDDVTMSELQQDLNPIFKNLELDVSTALRIQSNNSEVAKTVISTLADIFGLTKDEVPEYEDEDAVVSSPDTQPDDDAPTQGDDGGAGTGEMEYGSDDTVYDPETGEFVSYGTLINQYQALVISQLKDGKLPTSLEDFINDYFATLFAGFGDGKDN